MLLPLLASSSVLDFESDFGAVRSLDDVASCQHNTDALNIALTSLSSGDTLLISNTTYCLNGGVSMDSLTDVTIQLDGTLSFSQHILHWPTDSSGSVQPCIYLSRAVNVVVTSSGKGTIDGNGSVWWGLPGIGYLVHGENRPRLFHLVSPSNVLVENLLLRNSPYWTFYAQSAVGLEISHVDISNRRDGKINDHDVFDLTAFNTDGFDVEGTDVWIHDCDIWVQDDCIAVKGTSSNMLFERITASGVGLTIGSIGSETVRNITFRDCYMPRTYKGIYLKFRDDYGGLIEDITFENIYIDRPTQWPIWIGPAQQSDSDKLCAAHPCSICWPMVPSAECNASPSQYNNILLKNVTINNPRDYVGVILGNSSYAPMTNIVFEDVVVNDLIEGRDMYKLCEGVVGAVARGKTFPVPACFEDQTDYS